MPLRRLLARSAVAALLWLGAAMPASAAVTITFWSHEGGGMFPHAFISLRGRPDAGGPPVDLNVGFTARHITPAILFGSVPGMLDAADRSYLSSSDAHFSLQLSDAQYAEVLQVIDGWGPHGDQRYNLNKRNCVTFAKVIAERLGLAGTDQPTLMKKPHSFMEAVEAANTGRVVPVEQHGDVYIAALQPVPGIDPKLPLLAATSPVDPASAVAKTAPAAPPPATGITAQSMSTSAAR